MKRILIASILASLLVSPIIVFAQTVSVLPTGPTSIEGILSIMDTIVNWIFTIILVVAVIFILLAALQFLTAQGDPGKVASARQSVLYALIGVAVAFMARGLVSLVKIILDIT
jgi:phosphoglycerol transferase MdoB-like AlkP superfamily enzyme